MTAKTKTPTLPVVDVDQAFPLLTTDGSAGRGSPASSGDQAPTVAAAIRDVLGWRPRPQDPRAFTAALNASFELTLVQGHVVARHVARGFAVQADLGGVTGGQASLYTRATTAHQQITRMLESLVPLRPDADPEDCAAYRTLVRDSVRQVVQELGMPGGPRVPLVDAAFRTLTGWQPGVPAPVPTISQKSGLGQPLTAAVSTGWSPAPAAAAGSTSDDVPGTLGAMRDRFGLTDDNVNTVEEEKIRTSFLTLVDLVVDLQRSWEQQRVAFGSDAGRGYLGTELILINRLLAAAGEQVEEVEMVLDSALVSGAERQTIVLDTSTRLTLDGLLSWMRTFLTEDGPRTIQDTGRDGVTTSFTPTVLALLETLRTTLVCKLLPCGSTTCAGGCTCGEGHAVSYLPIGCCTPLPPGMYAARTKIAVSGLCNLLERLSHAAARIGRFSRVVLFDVTVTPFDGSSGFVQVAVRGLHLRPGYLPVFLRATGPGGPELVRPLHGSASTDDDTLVGIFRVGDFDPNTTLAKVLGGSFTVPALLPASAVPLGIIDGESGQLVSAPPVLTWPELRRADRATSADVDVDGLGPVVARLFGPVPADQSHLPETVEPAAPVEVEDWWERCEEACGECEICTGGGQDTLTDEGSVAGSGAASGGGMKSLRTKGVTGSSLKDMRRTKKIDKKAQRRAARAGKGAKEAGRQTDRLAGVVAEANEQVLQAMRRSETAERLIAETARARQEHELAQAQAIARSEEARQWVADAKVMRHAKKKSK